MRKVAGEHPSYIHEFLYISHLFHLFILLSYLIFELVCLTLSLADTPGIVKYARLHIQRYTHIRTHKNKKHKKEGEKGKKEDVTTISKSQSLTSVRIKDCTLRVPNSTTTLFLYE